MWLRFVVGLGYYATPAYALPCREVHDIHISHIHEHFTLKTIRKSDPSCYVNFKLYSMELNC